MQVDYATYRALPGVNWSTLKHMRVSPRHYRHARDNPRPDTAALSLGRMVHARVFEPIRFASDYVVWPAKNKRRFGKKWDAFKAEHPGKEIVTEADHDYAQRIGDALDAHPVAAPYIARGEAEKAFQWTDEATRLPCKCRVDFLSASVPATVDLKTAADISPYRFAGQVARLGYHGQGAFYSDGVAANGHGALPFVLIAVESSPPFDVIVYRLDEDSLYAGTEEYRELLTKVAACTKSGRWPGRFDTEQTLRLPAWVWGDDEEGATEGLEFGDTEKP